MAGKRATIGASARVRGRIAGDEDLVVLGRVDGEIDLRGALEIDGSAVVRARVRATAVRVAGLLVGDVVATDLLHLGPTARVIGELRAKRLVIEPGARVSGGANVDGEEAEGPRRSFAQTEVAPQRRPVATQRPAPAQPHRPIVTPTLEPEIEPSEPRRGWSFDRVETEVEVEPQLPRPSVVPESPKKRVAVKMRPRGGT